MSHREAIECVPLSELYGIDAAVKAERERWIAALLRFGNAGGYQQMAQAQAIIMEVAGPEAAGIEIGPP